jgi:general secretion pathway protein K
MGRSFYVHDQAQLQALAESGIDIGLALLYRDRQASEHDSLIEPWSVIQGRELGELFGEGDLRVSIVDLSGRMPINKLAPLGAADESGDSEAFRQVLLRLLTSGEFAVEDETEARIIVDSLTDWLDGNDDPLPYGAENSYYLGLERPRPARNGPLEFFDELLQIRGMTEEVLYGTDEKKGLAEYISIYGNGRININTAPALLLQALAPGISEEDVNIIDEFRREEDSGPLLTNADWYRSVVGWPGGVIINPSLIATRSSIFKIESAARFRTRILKMTAQLGRSSEEIAVYLRSME